MINNNAELILKYKTTIDIKDYIKILSKIKNSYPKFK